MKSISNLVKIKILTSFILFGLSSASALILAQTAVPLPQINARFSNPEFIPGTRMYCLDVELNSSNTMEILFGMNVRFFYDASKLDFRYFDQYSDGYGSLGDPAVVVASGASGFQMFGIKGATAFVNGTIQRQSEQSHLGLAPNIWVKAFRICFRVPTSVQDDKSFCPSVLWDIKPKVGGGFLMGDDGLVITIVEKDPTTPDVSAPAISTGTSLNWDQTFKGMPYGNPTSSICVSLQRLSGRSEADPDDQSDFKLFQNEPNPFDHGTVIQFIIPATQEVSLKFYDVTGKILKEITGEYKEGKNAVNISSGPWTQGAKVVFYRMETEGFRSKTLKMVFINE